MDVAIVGAGPAGAWAAYRLARRGAQVTIFDPSHPREKPCGGGVTGRALDLVGGAVTAADCPVTVIGSARFTNALGGTEAALSLDPGALIVASRAFFDAALLTAAERAGATLVRTRVDDVEADSVCVRVHGRAGTYRADFLVGADGAGSLVRRRIVGAFERRQLSLATGFFAHGVASEEIVIELVSDPPGYLWSFPRPDHLAIGLCAQGDAGLGVAALRARAADWMRRTHVADGARLDPYSWPIPSLSAGDFESLTVGGPRWCLIGDAAGLVDPITREGIYFALASGAWAADAIDARDPSARYAQQVHDEAVPELARAARFKTGFFNPAFSRLMVRSLRQSPAIRAVMADLVAGRQSYRSLKWRLLGTLEIGLAWRAVRRLLG